MTDLYGNLLRVFEECQQPDWDGYEAEPVNTENYLLAKLFVDWIVSNGLPDPDIGATPSGGISFEWRGENGHEHIMSVSIMVIHDNGHIYDRIVFAGRVYNSALTFSGELSWHPENLGYIGNLIRRLTPINKEMLVKS